MLFEEVPFRAIQLRFWMIPKASPPDLPLEATLPFLKSSLIGSAPLRQNQKMHEGYLPKFCKILDDTQLGWSPAMIQNRCSLGNGSEYSRLANYSKQDTNAIGCKYL